MLPIVRIYDLNRRRRERNQELIGNRRVLRNTYNPFQLPDLRFRELYRLNKELARELIEDISMHIRNPQTNAGTSVEKKVLVALRFYATGSYQRCVGEEYNCGLSQSAIHNCIHEVTGALENIVVPQKIRFPETVAQRNIIKHDFMEKFGFPGTFGAIDGTHIAILKPQVDEHNFINRKGFHSINCQLICDAKLKITNFLANFGGSSHDSFVWNNSQIKNYIQGISDRGELGWLVGDSGYAQTRIVMTPIENAQEGTPQARYTNAQMRARNTIERCIGLLKMRFRCLAKERSARYKPSFVCKMIKVCAALHNMCVEQNIQLIEEEDIGEHLDIVFPINQNARRDGFEARDRVVQRYFIQ